MGTSTESIDDALELIADSGSAAYGMDRHDRIVYWNEGATKVLGWTADEVLGRACFEVIAGRDTLFRDRGIAIPAELAAQCAEWGRAGHTVVLAGWGGQPRGAVAFGGGRRGFRGRRSRRRRAFERTRWRMAGRSGGRRAR